MVIAGTRLDAREYEAKYQTRKGRFWAEGEEGMGSIASCSNRRDRIKHNVDYIYSDLHRAASRLRSRQSTLQLVYVESPVIGGTHKTDHNRVGPSKAQVDCCTHYSRCPCKRHSRRTMWGRCHFDQWFCMAKIAEVLLFGRGEWSQCQISQR